MGRFIGRSEQLHAVTAALESGDRVVTLTGAAGIGKSRLAYEAVGGSARIVDLADALTRAEVEARVLSATGMETTPSQIVPLLERHDGPILLDNADSCADATADFVKMCLNSSQQLQFVVTCRQRLGLAAEVPIRLGPLSLVVDELEQSESFQLLQSHAQQLRPGFRFAPDTQESLRRIIASLEGVPLALELAASRIVVIGVDAFASRLDERVASADGEPHLAAALELSWAQLAEAEQDALAQCSVFRGGFSLPAAEAVIELPAKVDMADVLTVLYQHSLVSPNETGGRFTVFRSIREFAAQKLANAAPVEQRHARYYAQHAKAIADQHRDATDVWRLLRLDTDNILAALVRAEDAAVAEEAALGIAPIIIAHGPFEKFEDILTTQLQRRDNPRLRLVRGRLRRSRRALELAEEDARDALQQAEATEDSLLQAEALTLLGVLGQQKDIRDAHELFLKAERLYRGAATRDAAGLGRLLIHLAQNAAWLGKPEETLRYAEEAVDVFDEANAPRSRALAQTVVANRLAEEEEYVEAMRLFDDAEQTLRDLGDLPGLGYAVACRGLILFSIGEDAAAAQSLTDGARAYARVSPAYEAPYRGYAALADWLVSGDTAAALKSLRDIVRALEAMNDRHGPLFKAYAAVCAAMLGETRRAGRMFDRAKQEIQPSGDASLAQAIDWLEVGVRESKLPGDWFDAPVETWATEDSRIARRVVQYRFGINRSKLDSAALRFDRRDGKFWPPGAEEEVDLGRRLPLKRLVLALIDLRAKGRDLTLSKKQLVAACWPKEKLEPATAANRLRVAVWTLRRAGFQDSIATKGGAYSLHPSIEVVEL